MTGRASNISTLIKAACIAGVVAFGQIAPVLAQPAQVEKRSAEDWLQTVQRAARKLNYAGTVVYQQGQDVRLSWVAHYFDGAVSHERLKPLDGALREFVRRADEVRCLIPESRRVIVERSARASSFPALADFSTAELQQHYSLQLAGQARVAGRDCQILDIRPVGNDRFGYRLWIDRATGLLLRSQTLDDQGHVIEQMTFAELTIGAAVDRSSVKPSWSTEGWRVEEAAHEPIDLAAQGWQLSVPPGFRKSFSVRRPLHAGGSGILQGVYTDGLATLSVFIEPAGASPLAEARNSQGATHAYSRRLGAAQVTVIGEVPYPTVKSVAKSVLAVQR